MASEEDFDYVVVDAGSAGCALAVRLAERSGTRVALIEAGGWDRDPWIHVPVGYYRTAVSYSRCGCVTEPDPGLGWRANPLAAGHGRGRMLLDQRSRLHPRAGR